MRHILTAFTYIFIVAVSLVISNDAIAEEGQAKPTPKPLPKSGSLSRTVTDVYDSRAVPGPWGSSNYESNKQPPISGSVSKLSSNLWKMKAYNNSEDTYSVSLAVVQFNRQGTRTKSDSYSYTMKPGQSVEREVSASPTTTECSLDLVHWKKVGGSAKKEAEASPVADDGN